jgi:ABC-type cobalamin transport system ATPase subunit
LSRVDLPRRSGPSFGVELPGIPALPERCERGWNIAVHRTLSFTEAAMYARSVFHYLSEQSAEEAFNIAWAFVSRTRKVDDDFVAQAFIANEIMRLMDGGERNRIRLANLAIAAYERADTARQQDALADVLAIPID